MIRMMSPWLLMAVTSLMESPTIRRSEVTIVDGPRVVDTVKPYPRGGQPPCGPRKVNTP
jgi:hypothetical protein